jgi:microcystin-dependent protein
MGEPFLSEIRIVSFNFPPRGWAFCNGQLLPINQNQALFSLLGTTYGGDGRVNFALPNMQGRAPIHRGNGHTLGENGGQIAHTLSSQEMPAHTHLASAGLVEGDSPVPTSNLLATSANPIYATASNLVALNAASVTAVGGSQPHSNMQPYLVLNFIIALQGIFPSQN